MHVHRADSAGAEVRRARERKPRGSEPVFSIHSASDPIVLPGIVNGNGLFKIDVLVALLIEPSCHGILAEPNRPRLRETSRMSAGARIRPRTRPLAGRRRRRPRRPAVPSGSTPLKVKGVGGAAGSVVVDVNHGSAARAARILQKPQGSPAINPDETEVNGVRRQRCITLESPPNCRLSADCRQHAVIARHLNFRTAVHGHFNRASSVPADAGYDGSARHGIGMCRLHKHSQNYRAEK
jgi:hypothetical protein